jgi:hypothetical protein
MPPKSETVMGQQTETMKRGVEIRIKNDTGLDLERTRVFLPGQGDVEYGAVAKGGVSSFRAADGAYRYSSVHVRAGDRELSFQPIDYLGEQKLRAGRYSYVLGVQGEHLLIRLEKVE